MSEEQLPSKFYVSDAAADSMPAATLAQSVQPEAEQHKQLSRVQITQKEPSMLRLKHSQSFWREAACKGARHC